eukprot:SAG31_NODE_5840_length_2301_cov_2.850136_2_plen_130_part_00
MKNHLADKEHQDAVEATANAAAREAAQAAQAEMLATEEAERLEAQHVAEAKARAAARTVVVTSNLDLQSPATARSVDSGSVDAVPDTPASISQRSSMSPKNKKLSMTHTTSWVTGTHLPGSFLLCSCKA